MITSIVYDSMFGSTERIARALAEHLAPAIVTKAHVTTTVDLTDVDLLLLGSPTHAGGPSMAMRLLTRRIPADLVRGMPVATFDTRFHEDLKKTGSAAIRMAARMEKKGARLIAPPESFFVSDMRGPLEEGELERAIAWAAALRMAAAAAKAAALSLEGEPVGEPAMREPIMR
jgi:flavodoxin